MLDNIEKRHPECTQHATGVAMMPTVKPHMGAFPIQVSPGEEVLIIQTWEKSARVLVFIGASGLKLGQPRRKTVRRL